MPDDQIRGITHHYFVHYPEHVARQDDPHYKDFDAYHRKTRDTARCYIGERVGFDGCFDEHGNPCVIDEKGKQSGLELHHAHIEFSLQNGISLEALEKDYPGVSDPNAVGGWVESATNFRYLCITQGANVSTADGPKPIEDIRPGELVVTADGSLKPVIVVGRKWYSGKVLRIGSALFTPHHRILTHRGWLTASDIECQIRMHGPDMIRLRCEKDQINSSVVRPVTIEMMDPFLGEEFSADPFLHNQNMLHYESTSIPNPHITFGGNLGSAVSQIPLRESIQPDKSAFVGAVQIWMGPPVRSTMKVIATDFTYQEMGWVTAVPVWESYTGWVHDLMVAQNHSFIADGIVAHNCSYHHRGAGGAHTAAHADWEASQYVRELLLSSPTSPLPATPDVGDPSPSAQE